MTPITSAIGLQSSAKFKNTTGAFQTACQFDVFNDSAEGCGMCEWEVGDVERG